MAESSYQTPLTVAAQPRPATIWQQFLKHRMALVGTMVLGPLVWNAPTEKIDFRAQPAMPLAIHPLGADDLAQDLLAWLPHGGRVSLAVELVAVVIGVLVGALAGMSRRPLDPSLIWLTDLFLALPFLLLFIYLFRDSLNGLVSPEIGTFVLIIAVVGGLRWEPVTRRVRARFLTIREHEYVEAARARCLTRMNSAAAYPLHNAVGPVIVAGTISTAEAIIAESTLSFLGLGFPRDTPTWGRILFDARDFLSIAPHWALFPRHCDLSDGAVHQLDGRPARHAGSAQGALTHDCNSLARHP